jgi:DNA polymerase-3 subunit delta
MPTYSYKDFSKILADAEKDRPVPVYLISGDPYLSEDFQKQLINRLLPQEQQAFNLEILEGEKADVLVLLERLQTYPFFPGRKIVSVKNPIQIFSSGNQDRLWKKAEEAWQKGNQSTCFRLIRSLLQQAGISKSMTERGGDEDLDIICEKLFPDKNDPLPDWFKEALKGLKDHPYEESQDLDPEHLLQKAIHQGFPKDHILILQVEALPSSKKIVKTISEHGVVLNLSIRQNKKGEQLETLRTYLRNRLSQEGKTIQAQAESLLLGRIDPEVYLLEMEIQKLLAYLGERKQILSKDVSELVAGNREEPLYELTTVLGEQNLEEGLRKLKHLWEQGFNPLQILAGITNAMRRLLMAKELLDRVSEAPGRVWQDFGAFSAQILPRLKEAPLPEILSKTHPFVLFQTLKTSRKFSSSQLISALQILHEADRRIKTSAATPTSLLEDFIFSFCKKN